MLLCPRPRFSCHFSSPLATRPKSLRQLAPRMDHGLLYPLHAACGGRFHGNPALRNRLAETAAAARPPLLTAPLPSRPHGQSVLCLHPLTPPPPSAALSSFFTTATPGWKMRAQQHSRCARDRLSPHRRWGGTKDKGARAQHRRGLRRPPTTPPPPPGGWPTPPPSDHSLPTATAMMGAFLRP